MEIAGKPENWLSVSRKSKLFRKTWRQAAANLAFKPFFRTLDKNLNGFADAFGKLVAD